ncbi:MAG: acetoin utilization deacetylase AcuC-like enzyme [bacterium]|jgi:acetoin utilization deacetylase AcuC-like enzyme
MNKKTGLLTDPIFLEHDTGQHPENAGRLKATVELLEKSDLWTQLDIFKATKASFEDVALAHDPEYIEWLHKEIESGASTIGSPDCAVCSETFDVALHAIGGVLELTKKVSSQALKNGFGLIRPPGHHAEYDCAMGFCYFNNIAVCAEYLIQREEYKKVLIVDFDVHHGNGTQHIFEERKDVFYCSIHEDPTVTFPGTGDPSERGVGEGEGFTLNVAAPSFSGDDFYLNSLNNIFLPEWEKYSPDFVLISAGFDAHKDDPLARINISQTVFEEYTKTLCALAEKHCSGKVVSLLEGGYNLTTLPTLIQSHIQKLIES